MTKPNFYFRLTGMVVLFVAFMATFGFFSCKKDRSIPTNSYSSIAYSDSLHDEVDTSDAEFIYPDSIGTIPTSCVSVSGGILQFANSQCFQSVMGKIANRRRSDIEAWQNYFGFYSRFNYYEDLELDSSYDDEQNAYLRLGDPYFESVLSADDKISIGDTLYSYDFSSNVVVLTFPGGGGDTTIALDGNASYKKGGHDDCKIWTGSKYYDNNTRKIKAYKWNRYYIAYTSMGVGVEHYKKNSHNKWKKDKTGTLTLFIDQWHKVEWLNDVNPLQIFTKTFAMRFTHNESTNQWVLDYYVSGPRIHVNDFERFHCYRTNVEDDLHHDTYCQ